MIGSVPGSQPRFEKANPKGLAFFIGKMEDYLGT